MSIEEISDNGSNPFLNPNNDFGDDDSSELDDVNQFDGDPDGDEQRFRMPVADPYLCETGARMRSDYNHENTVKRYRDFLAGKIKYWNPAKQAEFEQISSSEGGGPPPPPEKGPMIGVEVRAEGQSKEQMLEVRDIIRYTGRKNRKLRGEALDGLEPGTPAYEAAYAAYQDDAMKNFTDGYFSSPSALLPRAVALSRTWVKGIRNPTYEAPMGYDDLGSFGNMIAGLCDNMEVLFNFGHSMKLALVTRIVVLASFRYDTGMRPALLVPGAKSSGKSFVFEAIEKITHNGVFNRMTFATVKSMTSNADANLQVHVIDEGAGALVGQRSSTADAQQEAIVKSSMTNKEVVAQMLSTDEGKRVMVESVSSRIGTFLIATNDEIENPDAAIIARYIVWPAEVIPPGEKEAIENKMYAFDDDMRSGRNRALVEHMQLDSLYVMIVEMAIAMGAIRDVNMDAGILYYQMFDKHMTESGSPLSDSKRKKHVMEVVRTLTIMHACSVVFSGETTRSWRYEADGETPRSLTDILPRALREVERLLTVNMEAAVFGFTLLDLLWNDSEWPAICTTVRNEMLKFDKLNGGQGVVDADGRGGSMPIEAHHRGGLWQNLQERISERADITARAYDQDATERERASLAAHGTLGTDNDASQSRAQFSAVNSAREERNAKYHEETEMRKFINANVPVPFMPITLGDHGADIAFDPQYIEVVGTGTGTLESVAMRIRESQRGSKSSVENIMRMLRYMRNKSCTSRIWTWDVRDKKLKLDKRYRGQEITQPAVKIMTNDALGSASFEHMNRNARRFFVCTELLVSGATNADLSEMAVRSMQYDFTLTRRLLTGLYVHARERALYKKRPDGTLQWSEFGDKRVFWEVFRCVDVKSDPTRSFSSINYNRVRDSTDINLCMQELGVAANAASLAELREKRRSQCRGVERVNNDPDLVCSKRHGELCGVPESEIGLCSSLWVDLVRRDFRAENPEKFPQIGLKYEDKVREIQAENMSFFIARKNPNSMNQTVWTRKSGDGQPKLVRSHVELMKRLGQPHMIDLALWNGKRSSRPSPAEMPEARRERIMQKAKRIRLGEGVDVESIASNDGFSNSMPGSSTFSGASRIAREMSRTTDDIDINDVDALSGLSAQPSMQELQETRKRRVDDISRARFSSFDQSFSDVDPADLRQCTTRTHRAAPAAPSETGSESTRNLEMIF